MQEGEPRKDKARRRGLFGKYVAYFAGLVVFVLAVNGGLETWFMYRETTDLLASTQLERADTAARRIEQFVADVERQISWATRASADTVEQRRADYALLLQQVPAIDRVVPSRRRRQRAVATVAPGSSSSRAASTTPAIRASRNWPGRSIWLSPVYFDGLEPFMAIAMAHSGRNAGSTVAEINLKFLSISSTRSQIGKGNEAYVVGPSGRLLAHSGPRPPPGQRTRGLPQVAAMVHAEAEPVTFGTGPGRTLGSDRAAPRSQAEMVRLLRPAAEQGAAAGLQPALPHRHGCWRWASCSPCSPACCWRATWSSPIRALQVGARQLEASDFGHRIQVRTADEIEELADRFNRMADQLQGSYGAARAEGRGTHARSATVHSRIEGARGDRPRGRVILDIKFVLATIVTRAVELTQADGGAIYSYDAARGVFELAEAHGLEQPFAGRHPRRSGQARRKRAWALSQERRTDLHSDSRQRPNFPLRDITLAAGFNSALVVPLLGTG